VGLVSTHKTKHTNTIGKKAIVNPVKMRLFLLLCYFQRSEIRKEADKLMNRWREKGGGEGGGKLVTRKKKKKKTEE